MLGGIDPILIFQIFKKVEVPSTETPCPCAPDGKKIPVTSKSATQKKRTTFAVIPIYLSEEITGLFVETESKNIDIDTDLAALVNSELGLVNQKPLGSVTTVNLIAKKDSLAWSILLALSEMILDKLVSQDYEVSYVNGPITVFGGLIHGFSYDQDANNTLIKIKMEISKGRPKPKTPTVGSDATTGGSSVRAASTGGTPAANASTISKSTDGASGASVIRPKGNFPSVPIGGVGR